jgi:glycerol-3-phosphate dehydrogenase (NAD(P)+)
VLAIACGISDGLKLGDNARAALLTRGLVELQQLLPVFGGKPSTAYGLAGVGDLWLTATGDLSRNRQLGQKISKGTLVSEALKQIGTTCEGFHTVAQVERLRKIHKLELPICAEVFQICYKNRDPKKSLVSLMTRALKAEESTSLKPPRKKLPKR